MNIHFSITTTPIINILLRIFLFPVWAKAFSFDADPDKGADQWNYKLRDLLAHMLFFAPCYWCVFIGSNFKFGTGKDK